MNNNNTKQKPYDVNLYANYLVNSFVNLSFNTIEQFYFLFGINSEIFKYCLRIINVKNANLFNKFVFKMHQINNSK